MLDRDPSALRSLRRKTAAESGFYRFHAAQVYLPRPVVQMTKRSP
jgi:hypothetical protein